MGRRRGFSREAALEAAMELFWHRGYERTSVAELLRAMRINRFSLYHTFGDKPELFVEALTLYRRRWAAFIGGHLEQEGSPRAALLGLIRAMGEEIVDDKLGRGCLIANSAFALAELPPEAAAIVTGGLHSLEDAIAGTIARAQRAGEISRQQEARTLARFVIAAVNGIRAAGRVERDRGRLRALTELALSVLH